MNAPRAVIFDVDGTLIDSVDFHARAWVDAFGDFGHPVQFDEVRRQIGKGGDQLMPVFLDEKELGRIGKRLEEHRGRLLKQRYLPQFKAFPAVRALLQRALDSGLEVALGSSAKEDELSIYKRIADIEDLISVETSSGDVRHSKPCPDIFDAAVERLRTRDRREIIVVGDTPYDAQAAKAAGLRTVGLRCGGWSEAELRTAGCIAVYENPADLLARYDTSPLHR